MIQDPLLKRFIRRAYKNGHGQLHLKSTEEVRAHLNGLAPTKLITCESENYAPQENIRFRIYRSKPPQRTIFFVRASAYTGGGTLDETDGICDKIRNEFQAQVVSIDFRSPPQYKFPYYFEDVLATTLWIKKNAQTLQLPKPFVSWGESSGGAIVASLNQYLTQTHQNLFQHQVLIYPLLDLVNSTPSREQYGSGYMLDLNMIDWLEKRILNNISERTDFRASPGLHTVPSQPDTLIMSSEFDPLRDEAQYYAKLLAHSNTNVEYLCAPDMIHGFMRYFDKLKSCQETFDWIAERIKTS